MSCKPETTWSWDPCGVPTTSFGTIALVSIYTQAIPISRINSLLVLILKNIKYFPLHPLNVYTVTNNVLLTVKHLEAKPEWGIFHCTFWWLWSDSDQPGFLLYLSARVAETKGVESYCIVLLLSGLSVVGGGVLGDLGPNNNLGGFHSPGNLFDLVFLLYESFSSLWPHRDCDCYWMASVCKYFCGCFQNNVCVYVYSICITLHVGGCFYVFMFVCVDVLYAFMYIYSIYVTKLHKQVYTHVHMCWFMCLCMFTFARQTLCVHMFVCMFPGDACSVCMCVSTFFPARDTCKIERIWTTTCRMPFILPCAPDNAP